MSMPMFRILIPVYVFVGVQLLNLIIIFKFVHIHVDTRVCPLHEHDSAHLLVWVCVHIHVCVNARVYWWEEVFFYTFLRNKKNPPLCLVLDRGLLDRSMAWYFCKGSKTSLHKHTENFLVENLFSQMCCKNYLQLLK